jgi:hypothetical protein
MSQQKFGILPVRANPRPRMAEHMQRAAEGDKHPLAAASAAQRIVQDQKAGPIGNTETGNPEGGKAAAFAKCCHASLDAGLFAKKFHPGKKKQTADWSGLALFGLGVGQTQLGGNNIFGSLHCFFKRKRGGVKENRIGSGFQG